MKKIGWLFLMLAVGMILGSFWQILMVWGRAGQIERVEAVVIANRVSRQAVENPQAEGGGDGYVNEHRAEYLLEYSVGGKSYRHWERDTVSSRQRFRVESALGQMGPGTKVNVYVDLEAPLKILMHLDGWEVYLGAFVFAMLGLVFAGLAAGCMLSGSDGKTEPHPLLKWMGAGVVS